MRRERKEVTPMEDTTTQTPASYTAPVVVEVGPVKETVRGTQYNDSADDTQYKT
jgi:hypothetical protein